MRRLSFLLTATLMTTLLFAACGSRSPQPASDSVSEAYDSSTVFQQSQVVSNEEAASNNATIKPEDITLIQLEGGKSSESVVIHTSMGDIEIELYRDQAPKAVDNFITHARNGYYNGMDFYKVVENYIIQSGAPADKDAESIYKDEDGKSVLFEDEFDLSLWNFRGALVMQNKGANRPDTNASEFFIVQAGPVMEEDLIEEMKSIKYPEKVIEAYQEIGGIPGFDWRHTVFGMVTGGMDVVDEIAEAATDAFGRPEETILIESITIK